MRYGHNNEQRQQWPGGGNDRHAQQSGPTTKWLMLDVERTATQPENHGDGEVTGSLDRVEALEQIKEGQSDQQSDGELQRAQASPVQVIRADEESQSDRQRQSL